MKRNCPPDETVNVYPLATYASPNVVEHPTILLALMLMFPDDRVTSNLNSTPTVVIDEALFIVKRLFETESSEPDVSWIFPRLMPRLKPPLGVDVVVMLLPAILMSELRLALIGLPLDAISTPNPKFQLLPPERTTVFPDISNWLWFVKENAISWLTRNAEIRCA